MPGAHMNLRLGPATYEVSVAVAGGQLVEPDSTTGKVKPATANSVAVLGVALSDAQPAGSDPTNPLNISWAQPQVAVAYGPCDIDVTYTGAAAFGALLVAGAAGAVSPIAAVTTPTAGDVTATRGVVGICTEPGGMAAAGVGRMRLRV